MVRMSLVKIPCRLHYGAAAKCFESFVEAMWTTVAGLGDRDTTCAIVGGVPALRDQAAPIPPNGFWPASRSVSYLAQKQHNRQ